MCKNPIFLCFESFILVFSSVFISSEPNPTDGWTTVLHTASLSGSNEGDYHRERDHEQTHTKYVREVPILCTYGLNKLNNNVVVSLPNLHIFGHKILEIYQLIVTNHNEKTTSLSVFIFKSLYSPLDTFSLLAVYYGLIYQHFNYSVEIWDMEILEPVLPLNYRKG